jgi:hypothetical protein
LQAIQQELVRLADLGRKVVSTEQMRKRTALGCISSRRNGHRSPPTQSKRPKTCICRSSNLHTQESPAVKWPKTKAPRLK